MSSSSKIASLLSVAALAYQGQAAKWDYDAAGNNVSHWAELYEECGFTRQSPIDLPITDSSACEQPLELQWHSDATNFAIRNNGHSLQAIPFAIDHNGGTDLGGLEVLSHRNDTSVRLKNSFFSTYKSNVHKEYCFDSFHLHWARQNDRGSEHTINGKSYPLELHLVHYSCDYETAGAALHDYTTGFANYKYDDDNVLGVIGVMFEIGEANPVLDLILDDLILDNIREFESGHDENVIRFLYTHFDLQGLLPESREMVAYLGSLTTPPCLQTVRWHVLRQAMTVSQEQMDKFRQLLMSTDTQDNMAPNFRPVQPLNNRKIYQCKEDVLEDEQVKEGIVIDVDGDASSADGANAGDEVLTNKDWQLVAIAGFAFALVVLVICLFCQRKQLKEHCCCCCESSAQRKLSDHQQIQQPDAEI